MGKQWLKSSSYVVLLVLVMKWASGDRGDYIGCYRARLDELLNPHTGQAVDECLSACEGHYYKYAVIGNESTCFCGNVPGQFRLAADACDTACPKNATQRCGGGGGGAASVYDTAVAAPGPPRALRLLAATETTARVAWTAPQAHSQISAYLLQAVVLSTYADYTPMPLQWSVPNTTLKSELPNLQPGSVYNISVAAVNEDEEGPNITIKVETEIGTPDPSPPDVVIRERRGNEMRVHIPEAKNVNGPVSMYRIVVSIELDQQCYLVENLGNYSHAQELGLPYYITAELDPDDIKNDFIIGDKSTYNGFYNAPLLLTNEIGVFLGIVSEKNHVKKIRYSESCKKIILNINEPEEVSPMVVALGAGIAIGVVLLLIGIGLLIILRKRIHLTRIQRGSQSMPLSLSEPCVEIENAGFLQEEDERVDYYGNIKRNLWNIPRNLIDIDISCVVGLGSYGKFTKCKVQQHGGLTPGLVQVINDREMEKQDKRLMLQELDLLIKTSEHENVISLIGICETNTTLFVVLQDCRQTLKEMLIQSRHRDLQNNKFCLVPESRLLQICCDVARGLEYLHSKKIFHKRLCCRNISLTEGGAAKVSGFGLAHARPLHETPDYTRWTAHEMLRQSRFHAGADVWSLGVLLWEALAVGATPYAHSAGADVAGRVLRGVRPPQPSYVADELFQVALQCWQVDPAERPAAPALRRDLAALAAAPGAACLSFTHYSGFEFEPYVPEYEIVS
ncbi:hypothetical protein JYU34_018422 [Plutella xylostella]|uniref:Tyrosine-protein kinase Wsck n=1 Tax=Plutella xylostella TaxID=51655 RepID=A0ABQ7PYY9_PLUXY|nr:hypothetical protein JYU34_018422 [Plutella xylostella]